VAKIINDKGCLPAGEEWLERNLLVVAGKNIYIIEYYYRILYIIYVYIGVAVGIAFLQVSLDLIITKA
jgi:hypothetical protein